MLPLPIHDGQRVHLHRYVRLDGVERRRADACAGRESCCAGVHQRNTGRDEDRHHRVCRRAELVQPLSADREAVSAVARQFAATRTARRPSATRCSWRHEFAAMPAIASSSSSPTASITLVRIRSRSRSGWAHTMFRCTRSASARNSGGMIPGTNDEATIDEDALALSTRKPAAARTRASKMQCNCTTRLARLGAPDDDRRKHDRRVARVRDGRRRFGMIVAFVTRLGDWDGIRDSRPYDVASATILSRAGALDRSGTRRDIRSTADRDVRGHGRAHRDSRRRAWCCCVDSTCAACVSTRRISAAKGANSATIPARRGRAALGRAGTASAPRGRGARFIR